MRRARLFAALAAASVLTLSTHAHAHAQASACGDGAWRLAGASAEHGESTAFLTAWAPPLDEMAECMAEHTQDGSCLVIEGHFDVTADDSPAAIERYGRSAQARATEAKALAALVLARLYGMGVPMGQMHIAPSVTERTFRGAKVTFAQNCPPPAESVHIADDTTEVTTSHEGAQPGHVTVYAGGGFSGGMFLVQRIELEVASDLAFVGQTDIGFFLHPEHLYVDVMGGLSTSPDAAQRVGFNARLQIGYRDLWQQHLRLGVAAGYRQASFRTFDTWLTRTWFVGLHAAQCFSLDKYALTQRQQRWRICAEETISPGGQQVIRARERGNQLQELPQQTDYRAGFDLGVRLEVRL